MKRFWITRFDGGINIGVGIGRILIRDARTHRPLFSERQGFTKWHHIGHYKFRFIRGIMGI